jgi:nicotinate dehydrogenase subunit A
MRLLHQRLDHDGRRFPARQKKPTEAEIKDALSGIKCRCGTHISILKAVKRAAEMMG